MFSRVVTRGDRLAVAALALLPALLVGPALRPGRVFAPCDIIARAEPWRSIAPGLTVHNPAQVDAAVQFHPWLIHAAREIRHERFPLWNPYAMCGTRFLANPQTSVLAPFAWPAYVLPPADSLWVSAWLRMAVTGMGMHVLLRTIGTGPLAALAGAAAYQWSGWNISWLRDTLGAVAAWFPWLLVCAELFARGVARGSARAGAGLAVVVALQFLSGHPETSFFMLLGTAAFVVWRACRGAGPAFAARAIGWGAAGAALASVLLVPFLFELRTSHVMEIRSAASNPGLPFRALLELLVPLYHGGPMAPPIWNRVGSAPAHSVAGAGALVWCLAPFALAAPRRGRPAWGTFFAVLAVAGAALAIENPVTGPLLARVPPFSLALNSIALLYTALAGAVLTGLGLQALLDVRPGPRSLRWSLGTAGVVAAVALVAFLLDLPQIAEAGAGRAVAGRVAGFLAASAAGLALIAVAARARSWRVPAVAALATIQLATLVPYARRTHGTSPAALFYPATPSLAHLTRTAGSDRVMLGMPNAGSALGLRDVIGYDAFGHARLALLFGAERSSVTHGPGPLLFGQPADSPLWDLLALRYALTPPGFRIAAPGWHVVRTGTDGTVYRNDQALPRARAVGRAVWQPDPAATATRLRAGRDDPRTTVLLEGPSGAAGAPAAFPPVVFEEDQPQRVVVRVRAPRAGWLVLTDSWAPGWIARADGRRVRIHRAEVAFRAVPLRAGDSRVEFTYAPGSFRLGLFISAVAAGLLVALAATASAIRG